MTTISPADPDFEELLNHLKETRGFDFSAYKRSTLMRRMRKRMTMVDVEGFADYKDFLEVHPDEFAALFDTILINVTSFFREGPAWDFFTDTVVPRTIKRKGSGDALRIWCAGC